MFRLTLLLVFLVNSQLLAIDIAVTGVVRTPDARPLAGVNVILKGTSRGTATFSQPGSKELHFEILSAPRSTQVLEVLLVNQRGRHRDRQSSVKLVHH